MRYGIETAETEYKGYTLLEAWEEREDCSIYGCIIYKDGKVVKQFTFGYAFKRAKEYVDSLVK